MDIAYGPGPMAGLFSTLLGKHDPNPNCPSFPKKVARPLTTDYLSTCSMFLRDSAL